jgi:glycosyltransferase involved in cell wall biosynthesis
MNVTIITGSPDVRCGVGAYTMQLLRALSKMSREINLTYLAPYGNRPEQLDASISYVNALPGREFREYVRKNQPEILHFQFPSATRAFYPYWRDVLLCRLLYRRRIIITAHESISKMWILTALVACKILSVRSQIPVTFCKRLNSKVVIPIKNPPMLPKVNPTSELRNKIRHQFNIPEKKKMVSFLGFLTPAVQIKWMLESCNTGEHELVIMGQAPLQITNRKMDYYERLCRDYNWDPDRVLKGYVPDLQAAEILAASDIVFLPFRKGCQESINTSYLAARYQEAYIITTSMNRSGYDPSQNAYFVPVGDVKLFKEALNFTPNANKSLISDIMTWETLADLHWDIYKQVI